MPWMYFDFDKYVELDDVEIDLESLFESNHRKNGVQISIPTLSGYDEIEFHVSFKDWIISNTLIALSRETCRIQRVMIHKKNGKQAARFEVVNSKGLPLENLTGKKLWLKRIWSEDDLFITICFQV